MLNFNKGFFILIDINYSKINLVLPDLLLMKQFIVFILVAFSKLALEFSKFNCDFLIQNLASTNGLNVFGLVSGLIKSIDKFDTG